MNSPTTAPYSVSASDFKSPLAQGNVSSGPSHANASDAERACEVGAVAPQDPADLSIFQHFKAPSQPPEISDWEVALKVTFYVLSFLIAVVGNLMVVLIITMNKRMRSTTNILLLNQAVSDLMVAAVCMWVHLGNSITPEWPFGPFVCKVNTFCQVVAVTASVLTMTAISVERLAAIVFPLRARWRARTSGVIIAVTWLVAGGVAAPHLFVRHMFQQRWQDRLEVWCAEDWPQVYRDRQCRTYEPGKMVYYFMEGVVMYLVPVLIMVVAYCLIAHRLLTRQVPGTLVSSTIAAQERSKRKVIKMLVAVLVCFVLCWTPQQVLLLYDVFRQHDQVPAYLKTVKYVALYVAYLNSALNPILYGGFNDNFRRGFRDVFRCLAAARTTNKVHPAGGGGWRGGEVEVGGGRATPVLNGQTPTADCGKIKPQKQDLDRHKLSTSSVPEITEQPAHFSKAVVTSALFGQSQQAFPDVTSASRPRRPSVLSDDTTHIAWQALHGQGSSSEEA